MKTDYASLLNAAQLEAVTTDAQHLRIIAGAGSGKTRVLTFRIAHLIDERGVDPSAIMAVTFTNKAANEMKERIEKLVPGSAQFLQVSTFHSFCARFLRKEAHLIGYPHSFTILDDDDSDKILIDILSDMGYKKKDPMVKATKSYIADKRTRGILPDQIKRNPHSYFKEEDQAIEAYRRYEEKKWNMVALDFDDLLIKTLQILVEFPEIREKWSYKYRHILVDEFQDTNDVQYTLLMKLINPYTCFAVVGDPDQTIYTWRGANQRLILDFPTIFPDYQDVILDRNYRSTKNILEAANTLIRNNKKRVPKKLYTEGEDGSNIIGKCFDSAEEEAKWIAREIVRIAGSEKEYSEIAILYRASYVTRAIESELVRNKVPYRIFGGLRFYQRKEVKDVLCYFRLIINAKDDVAFDRIINVPRRSIGDSSQAVLGEEAAALGLSKYEYALDIDKHPETELSSRVVNALIAFTAKIEAVKDKLNSNTGEVYSKVLKDFITDIKYYEFIAEEQGIDEDRAGNVNALFDDLNSFIKDNPNSTFEEYLQNISLLTSQDDMNGGNYVSLMTIHVAKGLEFDNVFIMSMNQGVFPSQKATSDPTRGNSGDAMEEERRLAYVAITRCRKNLWMTSHSGYSYVTDSRAMPSQFFKEAGVEVKGSYDYDSSVRRSTYSSWGRNSYGSSSGFSSSRPGFTPGRVHRNEFGDDSYDDDFDQTEKKPVEEKKPEPAVSSWKIGDRCEHAKFGEGTVVQIINEAIIVIDFDDYGKKTMQSNHPSLEKLSSAGGEA